MAEHLIPHFRIQLFFWHKQIKIFFPWRYNRCWDNCSVVHSWKHCEREACMVSCRHGCTQCTWYSHRTKRPHPDPGQHVYLQCIRMAKKNLLFCFKLSTCLLPYSFYCSARSLPSFAFLVPPSSTFLLSHLPRHHTPLLSPLLIWMKG